MPFAEQPHGLDEVGHEDAIHEETGRVVDYDREFAEGFGEL